MPRRCGGRTTGSCSHEDPSVEAAVRGVTIVSRRLATYGTSAAVGHLCIGCGNDAPGLGIDDQQFT